MRALITGASGFVGKYLIEHLLASGDEVVATDRDIVKLGNLLDRQVKVVELDVCNIDNCQKVFNQFQPDAIYHLAGIAFVPEAEDNFDRALLVNVGGTGNVLRTCHLMQSGATVLVVSSAEVYGRIIPDDLPITEQTQLKPANNYSLTKCMAELVCQRYGQFGYVRPIIARPFNHIGPGQDERFVVSSFCRQLLEIAKGQSSPVIKVGNLEARRDFSDVRDIVRAYRLAVLKGQGIYNFGSGRATSVKSILDQLIQLAGVTVSVETDPARMRAVEVPEVYGSYAKAEKELGWKPEFSLEQTLKDVYGSMNR